MNITDSQEYFWGVELSKDKPTFTWTFKEEEDDEDYMIHTLFLKNAVLGGSSVKGERNIIEVETKNFEKSDVKQPLLSLTLGQRDMCNLDVSFGHEVPVTFRLVEGSGPIALGGQQLVEFPPEEMMSQDESALEDSIEDEITEEESPVKGMPKKRKAAKQVEKKSKKGKMEESMSSADDSLEDEEDDDEDDEDDDEEEEDMEEDEEESSPEKGKKKKGKDQKPKKGPKTTKTSPKKAMKKASGKKGKK